MDYKEALYALHTEVQECVDHVGSANYSHRESQAKRAVSQAFKAFASGDYENIRGCLSRCEREDELKDFEYQRS